MFIIFFLFSVSSFYFYFFNFDGLTICHPLPATRYPSPVTRGKVLTRKENFPMIIFENLGIYCENAVPLGTAWKLPHAENLNQTF